MKPARTLVTSVRSACSPIVLSVAIALALGVSPASDIAAGELLAKPAFQAPKAAPVSPHGGGAHVVTHCGDSGPGSLRDAAAVALSGDTIDVSKLECSTITLETGAIAIAANDLAILGPGATVLDINGKDLHRILDHSGSGTLRLVDIAIGHGFAGSLQSAGAVLGGCIASRGNVALNRAHVSDCTLESGESAKGGCIAGSRVSLEHSTVERCSARISESVPGTAQGGAIWAGLGGVAEYSTIRDSSAVAHGGGAHGGGLFLADGAAAFIESTISGNQAVGAPYVESIGTYSDLQGIGGAIAGSAGLTMLGSTVSGNSATSGGGIGMNPSYMSDYAVRLINCTVSGNTATGQGGGIWMKKNGLRLEGTTVAFNHAARGGGGVMPRHATSAGDDTFLPAIDSTIVASNTAGTGSADVHVDFVDFELWGQFSLVGDANAGLPADTLRNDPELEPLANNGGRTLTHAIKASSPAFERGNNPIGSEFDQRGLGYPRVVGLAPDIGAFEYAEPADLIFSSGFEE